MLTKEFTVRANNLQLRPSETEGDKISEKMNYSSLVTNAVGPGGWGKKRCTQEGNGVPWSVRGARSKDPLTNGNALIIFHGINAPPTEIKATVEKEISPVRRMFRPWVRAWAQRHMLKEKETKRLPR